ncbi:hypothetical protein T07_10383 [Trichinella nelsoni]|uniref:DUF5641 domain-containing protein n=1 Tax=Trichinella nelsoni TaxID=6336 RepID=A0A0V0RP22_9BILA|nr:hypothetical protein T07_10383 [Trichinella nelsoni]
MAISAENSPTILQALEHRVYSEFCAAKQRPKKGDILLMKQEGVPKNPYPLDRIIECYEG